MSSKAKTEPIEDEIEGDEDVDMGETPDPDDEDAELNETKPDEPAYTEDAMGVRTLVPTATAVAEVVPQKVKEPTLQMQQLGGEFLDFLPGVHAVQCVRQIGTPTTTSRTVKAKKTVTERDDTGADVLKTVEIDDTVHDTTYAWGEFENMGDPYPSLTGALRAQHGLAGLHLGDGNPNGYVRREYSKKEYGVWYVTEPTGKLPGYRYTIKMIPCPPLLARPPKPVKEPKAPKEPKAVKEPKAPKPPKEPKAPRAVKPTAADQVGTIVHTAQGEVPETVIDED